MQAVQKLTQERVFDALGSPVRREIVRLLSTGPQPVGKIAGALPVTRPAVSKHLRLLEAARLVRHDRRGTQNVYSLSSEGFAVGRQWLDGFWDDALARFALVAERMHQESE